MNACFIQQTIILLMAGAISFLGGCGNDDEGKPAQTPGKQAFRPLEKKLLIAGPPATLPTANPFLDQSGEAPKTILTLEGHEDPMIHDLAMTPDGLYLLSAGYGDFTVRLWSAESGELLDTHKIGNRPNSIAILPNGETAIVSDVYNNLMTLKIEEERLIQTGSKKIDAVSAGAFRIAASPSGSLLAAACFDKKLLLIETKTLTVTRDIPTLNELHAAVFSPDGKLVAASGSGNQFTIWDLATGWEDSYAVRKVAPDSFCYRLAFSPDGSLLATVHNESTISIWNVAERKEIHNWYVNDAGAMAVAFTPDGKVLSTAQSGKGFYFWETATKRQLFFLPADPGQTPDILFSPDGTKLITCDNEKVIRIWSH